MLDPSHAIGCTALAAAVLGVANPLSAIGPGMLMLAFWPVSWQSLYICVLTRVCWPAGGHLPSMAGPFFFICSCVHCALVATVHQDLHPLHWERASFKLVWTGSSVLM